MNVEALEINLTAEERFFALKSWVQAISESGYSVFEYLDSNEDNTITKFVQPFLHIFLQFLIQVDIRYIEHIIFHLSRKCLFENTVHQPSFIANLIPILDVLILEDSEMLDDCTHYSMKEVKNLFHSCQYQFHRDFEEILEKILLLKPSAKLFLHKKKFHFLLLDKRLMSLPDMSENLVISAKIFQLEKKIDRLKYSIKVYQKNVYDFPKKYCIAQITQYRLKITELRDQINLLHVNLATL